MLLAPLPALAAGCGSPGDGPAAPQLTVASLSFSADLTSPAAFYDFPYPSDLRLTDKGTPDLRGLPYPEFVTLFAGLRDVAQEHPGFPVVPAAYFKFSRPLAALDAAHVYPADAKSPVLLIDIDEASTERGTLIPTVATTPEPDAYVPDNLLAVAARPGFVLHPKRRYAFVVMKSIVDAAGSAIGAAKEIDALRIGNAPEGALGKKALELYAPLWPTLTEAGINTADVAAATVFTTGDVVEELAKLSTDLVAKYSVTLTDIAVDPDDGAAHDRYCELHAKVLYPQFQRGTPPFDTEGLFDFQADGLPLKQRDEEAPVVISLPKGEMPAAGYPLVMYFHGSGGLSAALVDRGKWVPTTDTSNCPEHTTDEWDGVMGCNTKGEGPAHVLAPYGFAMAGSALPVNPERLPGAGETEYLNFNNLAEGRDLFRQGVIEQRMLIEALSKIEIPEAAVAACSGLSLPPGATGYRFDMKNLFAQGQSMGGQYTNLVGSVEPRIRAVVPTGAGGFWSHFILITPLYDDPASLVGTLLLGTHAELTFMHPALQIFETAWEAVDPIVYMPRLARRPLMGHPIRSIYEPVGQGDSYFAEPTYDAMALSYGHKEAGDIVWPSMQEALALSGKDGLEPYPVSQNLTSEDGTKYTGIVVQYKGDGVYDPHAIYSQLDEVKHQYGCFLSSILKGGPPSVPAPSKIDTPCP